MKNKIAIHFRNLNKSDIAVAGGKGSHLGELYNMKLPIPSGFVVTTYAYENFLQENKLKEKIMKLLGEIDITKISSLNRISKKLRKIIISGRINSDIKDKIQQSFKKLNTKYVAVRSSATAEDATIASWAGELETYLNVTEDKLFESIKKCWASLFTPRALLYRFRKKLNSKAAISVAVVVQKMVFSESSGVVFTVHPLTKDKNRIVVEAGFGLGKAIAEGLINPDIYTVDKQELKILEKKINEQDKKFTRKGVVQIPKSKRCLQKLSDSKIIELAKLCRKIEKHYNFPQDIEWACEKNKLYILQTRPITT